MFAGSDGLWQPCGFRYRESDYGRKALGIWRHRLSFGKWHRRWKYKNHQRGRLLDWSQRSTTPGNYKAVIIANETSVSKGPGSVVMPKRITPEKYGTKESTPLKVELKAGANTANFDLK